MNRISFGVIFTVEAANPNGDPLNGGAPRKNDAGYGIVSDVCIRRKIRNQIAVSGRGIYCQTDTDRQDEHRSLEGRFLAFRKERNEGKSKAEIKEMESSERYDFCRKYVDVAAFGATVMGDNKLSVGIRGALSVGRAISLEKVKVVSMQITKSCNGVESFGAESKGEYIDMNPDRMGRKSYVERGEYVFFGELNPYFAEKNGFTEEDWLAFKEAIPRMLDNDCSASRPAGSMGVKQVFFFDHGGKDSKIQTATISRRMKYDENGFVFPEIEGFEVITVE